MRHINILAARTGALQRIHRTLQQPFRNETVEAADDNPETQSVATQPAINFPELVIFRHSRSADLKLYAIDTEPLSLLPFESGHPFLQECLRSFTHVFRSTA